MIWGTVAGGARAVILGPVVSPPQPEEPHFDVNTSTLSNLIDSASSSGVAHAGK